MLKRTLCTFALVVCLALRPASGAAYIHHDLAGDWVGSCVHYHHLGACQKGMRIEPYHVKITRWGDEWDYSFVFQSSRVDAEGNRVFNQKKLGPELFLAYKSHYEDSSAVCASIGATATTLFRVDRIGASDVLVEEGIDHFKTGEVTCPDQENVPLYCNSADMTGNYRCVAYKKR